MELPSRLRNHVVRSEKYSGKNPIEDGKGQETKDSCFGPYSNSPMGARQIDVYLQNIAKKFRIACFEFWQSLTTLRGLTLFEWFGCDNGVAACLSVLLAYRLEIGWFTMPRQWHNHVLPD